MLNGDDRELLAPEQRYCRVDVLDGVLKGLGRALIKTKEGFLNIYHQQSRFHLGDLQSE
jgi:hypothetical protein